MSYDLDPRYADATKGIRQCEAVWHYDPIELIPYLAKKQNAAFSPLCLADKLAIGLTPAWLYLPMVRATGEIDEYLAKAVVFAKNQEGAKAGLSINAVDQEKWFRDVQTYCTRWVEEHRDGREDTWTPATREG